MVHPNRLHSQQIHQESPRKKMPGSKGGHISRNMCWPSFQFLVAVLEDVVRNLSYEFFPSQRTSTTKVYFMSHGSMVVADQYWNWIDS